MRRVAWVVLLLFSTGGTLSLKGIPYEKDKSELSSLVPQEIRGWRTSGEDVIYDPETIFGYINGAGEVYRSYNFKLLFVRRLAREGRPDIVIDLFDMGSAGDAFGVFTHDLEGEAVDIGQDALYKGGLLSFWKDRFFVSLYSEEETDDIREVLVELGGQIASVIDRQGEVPDIIGLLPPENLDSKNVHYFHTHLILNYHFFVSNENILCLAPETEAVLAPYLEKQARAYLLLIRYPDDEQAARAHGNFLMHYMPDAREPGLVRTEDARWTVTKLRRNFLLIVFDAQSSDSAQRILSEAGKRIGREE